MRAKVAQQPMQAHTITQAAPIITASDRLGMGRHLYEQLEFAISSFAPTTVRDRGRVYTPLFRVPLLVHFGVQRVVEG